MILLAIFTLLVFLFLSHDVPFFLCHDPYFTFLLDDGSREPGAPAGASFALLLV